MMRKERFYYNEKTLRFEKIEYSFKAKLFRIASFTFGILLLGALIGYTFDQFLPSPALEAQKRVLDQYKVQNINMSGQIDKMAKVLDNIQERDAGVYRVTYGMEPVDEDVWNGGIGGAPRYNYLENYNDPDDMLKSTQLRADKLKRQLAIQSESLDELELETQKKKEKLASIPAIKPIREDKLKRSIRALSGFGMRLHPVFKRLRMHSGLDFTCPKGTPIQATGAGKVIKVQRKRMGYGTHVIIDHGYGYQTLYAHMASVNVKKGDKVTRGQQIGTVGNTGTSTAPHLHYEVIFNGKKVNPINYCMDGLSAEEYQELVNAAEKVNQSFD